MAHPNAHPVTAVQGGGTTAAPTLLGQGPARIPTGGKIRAGIKVLTKKAADRPTAFLLGNEHAGLTPEARAACDLQYTIPMAGFTESFNLSVATAISLYSFTQRRRALLGAPGDLPAPAQLALRAQYYAMDVRGADLIIARYRSRIGHM